MTQPSSPRTPEELVNIMWEKDYFSQWLGIQDIVVDHGTCSFWYEIKKEMLNGFGTVHGGVLFSAADSALAFAANSYDVLSVALEVSISFTKSVRIGEKLQVQAKEITKTSKTAIYDIQTFNEREELVCHFKGTVFKTSKRL